MLLILKAISIGILHLLRTFVRIRNVPVEKIGEIGLKHVRQCFPIDFSFLKDCPEMK